MSNSNKEWLVTTVNAVRELMVARLQAPQPDPEAERDAQMTLEELEVMWEELQGQAEVLERESRRHAEFFDYAPDAYMVTDASCCVREANHAAAELLQANREEMVGRPLSEFIAEPARVAFLARSVGIVVEPARRSAAWASSVQTRGGAAVAVEVSVRAIPLQRSGVAGLCWLFRPLAA